MLFDVDVRVQARGSCRSGEHIAMPGRRRAASLLRALLDDGTVRAALETAALQLRRLCAALLADEDGLGCFHMVVWVEQL